MRSRNFCGGNVADTTKKVDTSEFHTLVSKREETFRKHLEAREEYEKACSALREKINSLNKE
jgi:hypothetical protein